MRALAREASAELREFVEREGDGFPALDLVWRALGSRGKLLSRDPGLGWGLLPPLVCEAAGGDARQALPLSVALECFISAADVLDDAQDGDAADGLWRARGVPTANNVATLLLFLTQLAIDRPRERGVAADRVAEVGRAFALAGARACRGQQRDLDGSIDVLGPNAEAEYLGLIADKSASLVECACRSAAIVAGAVQSTVVSFAEFGHEVGIALQILNDLAGASSESADRSDLRVGKASLAAIFALRVSSGEVHDDLAAFFSRDGLCKRGPEETAAVQRELESTGGYAYAGTIADLHWEKALTCLRRADCSPEARLMGWVDRARGSVIGR